MRQYGRSSEASAASAERFLRRPFERDGEVRADRLLHAIVQLELAPPPFERRPGTAVAWRGRGRQPPVWRSRRRHRPGGIERDRAARAPGQRRIQHERSPGRRPRIVVSPLEVGRQSGAEVEARVSGIARERVAEVPGRCLRMACRQCVPRRPFRPAPSADRSARGRRGLYGNAHGEPARRPAAGEAGVAALLKLYWGSMPQPASTPDRSDGDRGAEGNQPPSDRAGARTRSRRRSRDSIRCRSSS